MTEATSSQLERPQKDPVRQKVDDWLEGISATRDGLFEAFFIEGPEGKKVTVTPENADEIEVSIRSHFALRYPELAIEHFQEKLRKLN